MSAIAGPVWIAALLLLLSGGGKLLRPRATRDALRSAGLPSTGPLVTALGVVEIAVAASVLVVGGPVPAAALAVLYAAFTAFLLRLRARAGTDASCSCLGTSRTPVTTSHLVLNVVLATAALTAGIAAPPGPAWSELAATPWAGVPGIALVALGAVLTHALYTELPPVLQAAQVLAAGPKGDR